MSCSVTDGILLGRHAAERADVKQLWRRRNRHAMEKSAQVRIVTHVRPQSPAWPLPKPRHTCMSQARATLLLTLAGSPPTLRSLDERGGCRGALSLDNRNSATLL